MYLCSQCREYKGITKCLTCGTLYCEFCDWDNDPLPHDPGDHKPVYDLYEWLDTINKRKLEQNI